MALYEVDRMVAILKPTQAFVDWINQHLEAEHEKMTLAALQEDCTSLLIPPYETLDEAEGYIQNNFRDIFENELEGWVTEQSMWPSDRSFALFQQWFSVEYHSLCYDLAYGDELENSEGQTLQ